MRAWVKKTMSDTPDCAIVFSEISKKLEANETQDSRRLFHGRGKTYQGLDWLNVDYFAPIIIFTCYRPSGVETFSEDWVEGLVNLAKEAFETLSSRFEIESLLIQRRDLSGAPIEAIVGDMPDSAFAQRKNIKFGLNFKQQNVGYFLDIEPARNWLEGKVKGKRVLNLFSYTCAFSVVAMATGAKSVVNIDMSKRSLDRGRENHKMNTLSTDNVKFFGHDIFKSWGKLKKYGPYDLVILDPPSFQKGSFIAEKDYQKTVRRSAELLSDEGLILACLNAPEILTEQLKEWVREASENLEFVEQLTQSQDFPESEGGRELKMLVYKRSVTEGRSSS